MKPLVAKVGGSLFDLPDLRHRLGVWASEVNERPIIFVPGGGAGADVVRQWDRVQRLGDEAAHWLALRVLSVNAYFLAELLSAPVIASLSAADALPICVIDAHAFCELDQGNAGSLPHTWDVTSDSIAARVAALVAPARNNARNSSTSDGPGAMPTALRGHGRRRNDSEDYPVGVGFMPTQSRGHRTPWVGFPQSCPDDNISNFLHDFVPGPPGGGNLTLLKSIELPAGTSWKQAADAKLVDAFFPHVIGESRVEVTWVNLRAARFAPKQSHP